MTLRGISLRNFRNYETLDLTFNDHLNLFHGKNAQGKSNLLEAIQVLALTRGFRSKSDRELARLSAPGFELSGEFVGDSKVAHRVVVCFDKVEGKSVSLDRKRLPSTSSLIGMFPLASFSPESHRITSGPPVERRRFLDMLLCQSSPGYLADLVEYNRVLRQRNALLAQALPAGAKNLEAWSESFANHGCRLTSARYQFSHAYAEILQQAYQRISASSLPFQLVYRSQLDFDAINPERFLALLAEQRQAEQRQKRTLVGPHLDDLVMQIGGKELRRYGSRGEHKTALMSLKMAEVNYLQARTATAPIVLLDDLPSELDGERMENALESFRACGQVFVTSLNEILLSSSARYEVSGGTVRLLN